MTTNPIFVPCEGSGCPVHMPDVYGYGICQMCGRTVPTRESGNGRADSHERQDILAMINRGDFG